MSDEIPTSRSNAIPERFDVQRFVEAFDAMRDEHKRMREAYEGLTRAVQSRPPWASELLEVATQITPSKALVAEVRSLTERVEAVEEICQECPLRKAANGA